MSISISSFTVFKSHEKKSHLKKRGDLLDQMAGTVLVSLYFIIRRGGPQIPIPLCENLNHAVLPAKNMLEASWMPLFFVLTLLQFLFLC